MKANYNEGKIYKIVSDSTDRIYIGSTCKKYLSQRLSKHVCSYKLYLQGKTNYVTSFDLIKNGDYDIVLLENVNCDNKEQLRARERYYIELYNNICVNKLIPNRSRKEHYEDNKNRISEQRKEYYEVNKDKILEQRKQYYEANKDKYKHLCICGCTYSHTHKERHERSRKHNNNEIVKMESILNELKKNRSKIDNQFEKLFTAV